MAKDRKKCYVVRVEDLDGFLLDCYEYVGGELGFQVWYNQLRRNLAKQRKGVTMNFPYYFWPVTEA